LTERDVLEIRQTVGKTSELASRFGVNRTAIQRVRRRETWAHLGRT
jgi:hypothetical protein